MEFQARCKAFSTEPMQTYFVQVDDDGVVTVYDDVAKHYTVCHILSRRTQARLRKLHEAKRERARMSYSADRYNRQSFSE